MTEIQLWSIAVALLVAAVIVTVVAVRRHQKRTHPHGHIEVDMTVPRERSLDPVAADEDPFTGSSGINKD
jgi:cytochrome c-type biogenesis protein CcmH/NrfF